ncbi:hypothetical protein ERT44_20940, partial [Stenotrophomonas sp. MA5]
EFEIEEIIGRRYNRRSRREEVRVKWKGWHRPTWEPRSAFDEAAALDRYETSLAAGGG